VSRHIITIVVKGILFSGTFMSIHIIQGGWVYIKGIIKKYLFRNLCGGLTVLLCGSVTTCVTQQLIVMWEFILQDFALGNQYIVLISVQACDFNVKIVSSNTFFCMQSPIYLLNTEL
jgi:hypothetical protein